MLWRPATANLMVVCASIQCEKSGKAPDEDDEAQDQPGQPGFEDGCRRCARERGARAPVMSSQVDVERAAGMPEAQEDDEHNDGGGGSDDGHERGSDRSGHEVLRDGEGDAGDEDGGPDFDHGAEAGEGPDEPEGNEDIEGKEDGRRWFARERKQIEAGDAVQSDDGNAHGLQMRRARCWRAARGRRPASGRKPRLMRMAAQTATGVPKPAGALKERTRARRR